MGIGNHVYPFLEEAAMANPQKVLHVTSGLLTFKPKSQPGAQPGIDDEPLSPGTSDTVTCPFTAYGTYDAGANQATVTLVLSSDPTTKYPGTAVTPPAGAQWAYQFDNIPPNTYKLIDKETSVTGYEATYVIDPVYVTQ
jgi:hypothetical protein